MSDSVDPTPPADNATPADSTFVAVLLEAAARLPAGVTFSLDLGPNGTNCPVCGKLDTRSRGVLRKHLVKEHGLTAQAARQILDVAPVGGGLPKAATPKRIMLDSDTDQKKLEYEWLRGGYACDASKAIFFVLAENRGAAASIANADTPTTADSFARCHWLLTRFFPAWRERLHEVADTYPDWKPFVREWHRLTAAYESERATGSAPKLRAMIRGLNDEGMAALTTPEPRGLRPGGKRWPAPAVPAHVVQPDPQPAASLPN